MSSCRSLRGMMEAGWSSKRVPRQLGCSDCVLTASSDAIQAQIAPLLKASVSSRRRLAEEHLGSWHPLRVLPLTPTHRHLRLEWFHARGNWTAVEWNQVVLSDRHIASTAGVRVWSAIVYNTRTPLVSVRGTMTAQRYVNVSQQPHVLPLMQRLPRAIFQQDYTWPHTTRIPEECLLTVTTFPWPTRSPDLSPIEHIWDHLG
ncbi:transposable element Tcb2 transposase [Trichonephila clavipes]|nr:transposable element Tcb2 transposase [Trichonephila clavipes]